VSPWQRATELINAMSLRERILLFATIMIALAAITEVFFIAPLNRLQAQRARQIEAQSEATQAQIERIEAGLEQSRRTRARQLTADIAAAQGSIEAVEREIAELSSAANDAAALRAVLARVPRPADKVSLLRVSAVTAAAAGAQAPAALDIVVAGSYLDLMDYLARLEAQLPQARWGALRVAAENRPAQATVRLVTPRPAR
jgi:MSHA biogenesis protein MshJ